MLYAAGQLPRSGCNTSRRGAADGADDECAGIRLAAKSGATSLHRLGALSGLVIGGDKDDRGAAAASEELAKQLQSRHASELNVHEQACEMRAGAIGEEALG